ncbi:DUF5107 domain-containing protein [Sinomonas sp. JGH33]|uniref:DUF5107 domain-containing protein n=1 Tax=Sinomonas terricola TaxID=3110330 RepID=A0ABU5TBK8_9MICC|nr:DUF5107 domain-containing protein [Sinomonas sp. JGH33]MEA5457082.1 DUF5107 domain-containing protein [Sinomonas sp. JGH33]
MSTPPSTIRLPEIPSAQAALPVAAWEEPLTIDTYEPEEPDGFPAFLNNRVYQGSSGRVYPLPFHERISHEKRPHAWRAVHLENRWIRVVILPELGGRIHIALDKVSGKDIFYRNNVIKPALVGLTGPWVSGGVEFNWPQHHRPATYLPTCVAIERDDDGSVTVWCSDHDPFARMKGMHGIRLNPDSSRIEARVRLYNRSETRQTFLWWANVAAAVHDDYQSFFPPDVAYVADHAKRDVTRFPAPDSPYYGIDYAAAVDPNDPKSGRLDWYRNIPVPTSYMVTDTDAEFFGGYDHRDRVGFVHWADRTVSPGKKQWTWGNAPFGWAWDRNLTDGDGPYVELMAGVYTDNQPDFAFLAPGETKTFSQYWYPIREIGPAHIANDRLAVHIDASGLAVQVGLAAAEALGAVDVVVRRGVYQHTERVVLTPETSPRFAARLGNSPEPVRISISRDGVEILEGTTESGHKNGGRPRTAIAPPQPSDVATIDELVHIATYLQQYRHATRSPEPYWDEVLARDPEESRATLALGILAYQRADYARGAELLKVSTARRTFWAPTPDDGQAHYMLGLALSRLGDEHGAREALGRASWDAALATPARYALAKLCLRAGDDRKAQDLLAQVRAADPNHTQSANLLAAIALRSGDGTTVEELLDDVLERDPLDAWALDLAGDPLIKDSTVLLDVALEYSSAGFTDRALAVLDRCEFLLSRQALGQVNVGPLISYHRARILSLAGREKAALEALKATDAHDARHAAPSRLDDVDAIRHALALRPDEALARALLGDWYYHVGREKDALAEWRAGIAVANDLSLAVRLHRNLGIGTYNVERTPDTAAEHYRTALVLDGGNAKLLYEADQLALRQKATAAERLAVLERHPQLIGSRDDLTVVYANLLLDVGRIAEARGRIVSRAFQPWEGGEGQVLAVWDRLCLAEAREALAEGNPVLAEATIRSALLPPDNLGEGRHPLANTAELHLVLGDALEAIGRTDEAHAAWERAAGEVADFEKMAQAPYSVRTIHAIEARYRLGRDADAEDLARGLEEWVEGYAVQEASVDFFATSLPSILLFREDPNDARDAEVETIRGQLAHLRKAVL